MIALKAVTSAWKKSSIIIIYAHGLSKLIRNPLIIYPHIGSYDISITHKCYELLSYYCKNITLQWCRFFIQALKGMFVIVQMFCENNKEYPLSLVKRAWRRNLKKNYTVKRKKVIAWLRWNYNRRMRVRLALEKKTMGDRFHPAWAECAAGAFLSSFFMFSISKWSLFNKTKKHTLETS